MRLASAVCMGGGSVLARKVEGQISLLVYSIRPHRGVYTVESYILHKRHQIGKTPGVLRFKVYLSADIYTVKGKLGLEADQQKTAQRRKAEGLGQRSSHQNGEETLNLRDISK